MSRRPRHPHNAFTSAHRTRRLLRAILAVTAFGVVGGTAASVHAQQKDVVPTEAPNVANVDSISGRLNDEATGDLGKATPSIADDETAAPKAVDDTPQPDALLEPESPPTGMSSGIGEMIGPFIKSMLMLAVVVGLAYLTLHKGLGKLMMRAQVGKRMKVVERVSLDQRRSLYLVDIDGKEVVLAGGEGGVVHIVSLSGGDITTPSTTPESKSFKDILQTPRTDAARDEQVS